MMPDLSKLRKLISSLPTVYQPVYVGGECVSDGARPMAWERLKAIMGEFDGDELVIADIGSNSGFFAIQLAKALPKSIILSVEPDRQYADVQREVLRLEKIHNVVLVNAPMTVKWLQDAHKACTYFDCILMASVLHHQHNAKEFLKSASDLSRSVIIEIPDAGGDGCGKSTIAGQLSLPAMKSVIPTLEKMEYVYDPSPGDLTNYTHAIRYWYSSKSSIYLRRAIVPNINALSLLDKPEYRFLHDRQYFVNYDSSGWAITRCGGGDKRVQAVPGFNLLNISCLGEIMWPDISDLLLSLVKLVDNLPYNALDVGSHNLLLTTSLLKLIDYNDCGMVHDRYRDLHSMFSAVAYATMSRT